jgi:hypothetical protein
MPNVGCFFCGQSWSEVRKSFEHIWPEWLHGYANIAPGRITRSLALLHGADTQEFVERPLTTLTSNASLLNLRTREVCRPCNGGWMSQAQQTAKPLFLALAETAERNAVTAFSRSDARKLAFLGSDDCDHTRTHISWALGIEYDDGPAPALRQALAWLAGLGNTKR